MIHTTASADQVTRLWRGRTDQRHQTSDIPQREEMKLPGNDRGRLGASGGGGFWFRVRMTTSQPVPGRCNHHHLWDARSQLIPLQPSVSPPSTHPTTGQIEYILHFCCSCISPNPAAAPRRPQARHPLSHPRPNTHSTACLGNISTVLLQSISLLETSPPTLARKQVTACLRSLSTCASICSPLQVS